MGLFLDMGHFKDWCMIGSLETGKNAPECFWYLLYSFILPGCFLLELLLWTNYPSRRAFKLSTRPRQAVQRTLARCREPSASPPYHSPMPLDHPKNQGFQGFQWIRCDQEFYHFSSYQLRTMRHYGTCSPSLPWSWKVWMMQEHWWSIDTGAQGVMRRCRHVQVWESKALDRFVWRLFAWLSWQLTFHFEHEVLLAVPILEMCVCSDVLTYTPRWMVPRLCRGLYYWFATARDWVHCAELHSWMIWNSPMSFHSSTSTWHDTAEWILKSRDTFNRHGHVTFSYNSYSL